MRQIYKESFASVVKRQKKWGCLNKQNWNQHSSQLVMKTGKNKKRTKSCSLPYVTSSAKERMRAEDNPVLATFLKRATSYTSQVVQNEMVKAFSQNIIRSLMMEIKRNSCNAVMVDGTQNV